MYEGDSFFTLSGGGQIGLAVLSGIMSVAMVWLTWRLARAWALPIRIVIWAALFVAFVWLSPQIYYFYYMTIIDGLPLQVVIKSWPDFNTLEHDADFSSRSMAADARAGLGLLMLSAALAAGLDSRWRRFHQDRERDQARRER